MAGTTIKEFAEKLHEAKSESFRKLNPQIFGASGPEAKQRSVKSPDQRAAEEDAKAGSATTGTIKSPEQKLNKLETRWLAVLRSNYPNPIGIQNITLRLSDRTRYTPDLNVFWNGKLRLWETKGKHRFREKGILKLKWAAKEYPFFDFYLVTWDKDTQQWSETLIAKE